MTTGTRWLARGLLALYPRRYRERFGSGWWEAADWHWKGTEGRSFPRLRFALRLVRDSLVALPVAHWDALVESLLQIVPGRAELQQIARSLLRNRLFATGTIASVAIGIGASTAIFTVVNAVLLRPLPYPEAERLTIVWNEFATGRSRLPMSGAQVAELADAPGLFQEVGGIWASATNLVGTDGVPITVSAGTVTPNFFGVLGVEPGRGRFFEGDAGAGLPPPGIVVSDEFWRGALGASPDAVGSTVTIGGESLEIIGVLPRGFTLFFPPDGSIPARLDAYRPLPWDLTVLPPAQRFLRVVGRLEPGVGLEQAQRAVAAAGDRARDRYPELTASGDRLSVLPLHEDTIRTARPVLLAILAGAILFLFLAAANVASLLLARASVRGRELAIRSSVGATRAQLTRLLLTESLIVGVVGSALGLGLGWMGADVLWALRPEGIARVDAVVLDATVVTFTVCASLLSILLFGLAPLATTSRLGSLSNLRMVGSTTRGARARELVVVAEVAIGVILVAGAGLLSQSLVRLSTAEVGFERGEGLTFTVALPRQLFPTGAERARLAREIEARLTAIPGVVAAGATSHMPFGSWANWAGAVATPETPEAERTQTFFDHRSITTGYLGAIGSDLVEGRHFDQRDDGDGQAVVIIDRTMAEVAFAGESAVGRTLLATRYVEGEFLETPAVVVGVVESMRDVSPARPSGGQVFWPFEQSARWELTWLVRSEADPTAVLPSVREQVRGVDARLSIGSAGTLSERLAGATANARFVARLGGAFSFVALGLAALGLFGVVTYLTVQRMPEMGLRLVLGARSDDLLRRVLRKGLELGLLGAALGLVGAWALTRLLDSLLFGVGARDPFTLAAVTALFLGVALVASLLPAKRAARVDPLTILRS